MFNLTKHVLNVHAIKQLNKKLINYNCVHSLINQQSIQNGGLIKRGYCAKKQDQEPEFVIDKALQRKGLRMRRLIDPMTNYRGVAIPWEVSLQYMESSAYQETYGKYKVWQLYRRQNPGPMDRVPMFNRNSCVTKGWINNHSPCPICRDRYLVLHYKNIKLINQFIHPFSGMVYECRKTSLCQMQHENLLIAIHMAKDYGTISFPIYEPKEYDYKDYYPPELLKEYDFDTKEREEEDDVLKKTVDDMPRYTEYMYQYHNNLPLSSVFEYHGE